jgi:hypothetical protein
MTVNIIKIYVYNKNKTFGNHKGEFVQTPIKKNF